MLKRLMMGCLAALTLMLALPMMTGPASAGSYAAPPGYTAMRTPEGKVIMVPNRDLRQEYAEIRVEGGMGSVFAEARRVTTTKLLVGAGTGVIAGVICAMIGGGTPVAILCGAGGAVLGYLFLGPPVENWWEGRQARSQLADLPVQARRTPPRVIMAPRNAPRTAARPPVRPVAAPQADIVVPSAPPVTAPRNGTVAGVELFPCTNPALMAQGKWCGDNGTTVTPPLAM